MHIPVGIRCYRNSQRVVMQSHAGVRPPTKRIKVLGVQGLKQGVGSRHYALFRTWFQVARQGELQPAALCGHTPWVRQALHFDALRSGFREY